MMSCSKDVSNDSEIVDILSKDYRTSPDSNEKPLSPILTGGLSNRRFLIGRRLSHKRSSRVKLTDRFKVNDKGHLALNPINVCLPVSFDESLSASQTETLITHLDKLEELDNSRKNFYKALIRDNEVSDGFKKPKSPPPTKINKPGNVEETVSIENNDSQEYVPKLPPITSKIYTTGFQTAKGNSICFTETDLKTHSKLFEDIICPTQSVERQNKYTFLSKRNSFKQSNFETNIKLNSIINNSKSNDSKCLESAPSSAQSNLLLNNCVTPNVDINTSEKAVIQGKQFFGEEQFDDIKFSNENLGGFKKASEQSLVSANVCKNVKNYLKDEDLSLTQAICDSGISNTQMMNAFDEILYASEDANVDEFKGFTKDDRKESYDMFLNMENIIQYSHSVCRKRKRNMHFTDSRDESNTENDILPPKKRQRNYGNILNNVKNTFKETNNFGGFASASGKPITVSEKHMKNAEGIFNDIDFNIFQQKLTSKTDGYSNDGKNLVNKTSFTGFQKASGKSIKISENLLTKAKNIFDQLDADTTDQKICEKVLRRKLISTENKQNFLKENSVNSCMEYIENEDHSEEKYFQNCFSNNQNPFTCNTSLNKDFVNVTAGFSKASGKKVQISEAALNKAKNMFDNLSVDYSNKIDDQTLVAQSFTTVTDKNEASCSKTHEIFSINDSSIKNMNISKRNSISETMSHTETTPISVCKSSSSNLSVKNSKRKLGMSHFKPIQIGDNKLDRAKLLFDEDFSGISPLKPKQVTTMTYTSTPIKKNDHLTNIKKDSLLPKNSFSNFVDAAGITPIKKHVENVQAEIPFSTDLNILCHSPTKGDLLEDLETERRKLECRLRILSEREKLGREALHQVQIGKSADDKKPRKGLLYRTKTISKRNSLVAFVDNRHPGEITPNIKLPINAKNAENLHFTRQTCASIVTVDGAIIVPSSKDMVGLSEMKNAFEAMPGVEPRLIPKRWIKNHFKLIVWKLASYENMYPNYFQGCLTIENIMQQLKYRYDREIDRAERSALRKICEKDDAPQKRMVLFVSDIKMVDTKKYELELCDGWYTIRTIIDEPLCNQVIKGKIEIGTKLVISGAELLNCEGCHPLEATNLVCLKINCNSTRRAIWHAKLGYQRNSNPFPIPLHSIHPFGGTIAAIKVCIARVYPLKYLEKLEGCSVWRNRKSEEIASQRWENERSKKVEQIEHEVRKKFQSTANPISEYQSLDSDISSIKCPEILYGIFERSNDPECLQENLSTSQKEAIVTYQGNLSMKKQQEIAAEINANISKMRLTKRDVAAVLKLLVIDSIVDSGRPFSLFIWRPTDVHLQSLKEGKTFMIQNVLPRPNGDLNSTSKTTFKHESTTNDKYNKYNRRLVTLKELVALKSTPIFNEFDTVGIVVQTKIESNRQEVWITDIEGRLLHISVHDGPSTCLLLDNLKRGQPTTVCNLIFRDLKKNVLQAIANHLTVFCSYSRHKHLQEGLDAFKREMAKDVQSLLEDCDNKIEIFTIITDVNSFSGNFDVTAEA